MISRKVDTESSLSTWWSVVHALGQALSSVQVRAVTESPEAAISALLEHVTASFGAQSAALVTYAPAGATVLSLNRWPENDRAHETTSDAQLPYVAQQVLPEGLISIHHLSGLPPDAAGDRDTLTRWQMPSALIMGLATRPNPTLLAVGSGAARWPRRAIPTAAAQAVGDLVGNALGRLRAEHAAKFHEAELVHVARVATLGEFAASLAHELNQPLGAIMASAEAGSLFLDAEPPDVMRVRDIVRRIAAEDTRAYQIITRMRALLRRSPVESVALSVGDLITDTLRLVEHEAVTRRIALRVDVTPGILPIRGDPIQLQQVLLNLLLNAFDAVGGQPEPRESILITAAPPNARHVEIAVRDGGPGIPADVMPHLFDAFFTTKVGGLGMGLPICRSIIEGHGGTMFCRNNPDRGATVGLTLPAITGHP